MNILSVPSLIEELLEESGARGVTLAELPERHADLRFVRPEELRAALLDLVTEGRAELRGQRAGFAIHVRPGSPYLALVDDEET